MNITRIAFNYHNYNLSLYEKQYEKYTVQISGYHFPLWGVISSLAKVCFVLRTILGILNVNTEHYPNTNMDILTFTSWWVPQISQQHIQYSKKCTYSISHSIAKRCFPLSKWVRMVESSLYTSFHRYLETNSSGNNSNIQKNWWRVFFSNHKREVVLYSDYKVWSII